MPLSLQITLRTPIVPIHWSWWCVYLYLTLSYKKKSSKSFTIGVYANLQNNSRITSVHPCNSNLIYWIKRIVKFTFKTKSLMIFGEEKALEKEGWSTGAKITFQTRVLSMEAGYRFHDLNFINEHLVSLQGLREERVDSWRLKVSTMTRTVGKENIQ